MDYKLLLIFVYLLIIISYEEQIQIEVSALTGVLNSKYDSKKNMFTFDIFCEVNKNITNTIGKINISVELRKYPIDNQYQVKANCTIKPVRVAKNSVSETCLKCFFDTTPYSFINDETILIYSGNIEQDSETKNDVLFIFKEFDRLSILYNFTILNLNNLNDEFCIHNKYIFEINTNDNFEMNSLLESTICRVEISDDEFHKLARCAVPMKGNKMKCYVDVEEKKYKKGDYIVIGEQEIVPCDNGQAINFKFSSKQVLNVKEECGEKVFTNNNYLYFNKLFFSLLFIFILF
jgi:hypothetical protein